MRGDHGEGKGTVSENERRSADLITARDVIVRGLSVVGLIAFALILLLVVGTI